MISSFFIILACTGELNTDTSVSKPAQSNDSSDTETIPTSEPAADTAQQDTSEQPKPYASTLSATKTHSLEYTPEEVAHNPFRGFLTSYTWGTPANDFPHSLEFKYLPLSSVVVGEGLYDYTVFEDALNSAQDRNNHLVARFYLDYPALEYGMPEHLVDTISCTVYEDYGGGCTPDYSDPDLISTLLSFIDDFGMRYDGDQRLGFVQVGLLGFWGEWHTYPHVELFASDQVQQDVINAFDDAFSTTPIQLRYPAQDSSSRNIGFHDDSFGYSTIGDIAWFFQPRLEAAGADQAWQTSPIGGEIYPALQSIIFTEEYTVDTYQQDLDLCLEQTHASYLLNYAAFNGSGAGYEGSQKDLAQDFALNMGYQYAISELSIKRSHLKEGTVDVSIDIEIINKGSAPTYHPMTLNLIWNNENHELLELQNLLPQMPQVLEFSAEAVPVNVAQMPFELFISSPLALTGQQIRFANPTAPSGSLLIDEPLLCPHNEDHVELGNTVELNGQECTCDVDGQLYTLELEPCLP